MTNMIQRLLVGTSLAVLAASGAAAQTAEQSAPQSPANPPLPVEADAPAPDQIDDIIVTAQKRSESINNVGMSITAQTGEQLLQQGVGNTADLAKLVPGFTFQGANGNTPVYSIRGIGFHDASLASGQTVAIYADEVPIPFALATLGVDFDIAQVEILKGPQGTLFGQNSTGGAVTYTTAKPTGDLEAGIDLTYGRFNTSEVRGFVSGPLSSTLRARLAFRSVQGDGWQQRYGLQPTPGVSSDTIGKQNQFAGRLLLDWQPTDRLKVALNFNIRRDRSDTQVQQKIRANPSSSNPLAPEVLAFPNAPADNRAAAWDAGVDYGQNNRWQEATARIEYDGDAATLTSISAYQKYDRDAPAQDIDGTPYKVLQYGYLGSVETFYQELRATGQLMGRGNWIVGANYEHDKTYDQASTLNPLATSRILFGLPNTGSVARSSNDISTYGIYGNIDYPVLPDLSLQAGIRFTKADRKNSGCSADLGDGGFAAIFQRIQAGLVASGAKKTPIAVIPPGGCVTLDSTFTPALFAGELNEDNVSWRVGVNWKAIPGTLVYANVSKGYKAGSFPLAAAASTAQFQPVPQEELLAYEVGFKSKLASTLQLNASAFYYDYTNKQIGGTYIDAVFGRLSKLVTIPESRVYGFEVSANWRPMPGLTLTPAATYVNSRIQGTFANFTPQGVVQSFVGEAFPYAPRWQWNVAAEYKWSINDDWSAFTGGNVSYQGKTNGAFGQLPIYALTDYALVDLRAGVESKSGTYRFSVWGSNVFDKYYWTRALRSFDFDVRAAGMPARYGATLSYRFR